MHRNLRKHRKLNSTYQKEQQEYIQDPINKIRNSTEDRQSRLAWLTLIKVHRKKSTSRAQLKANNQEKDFRRGKNIVNICSKSHLKSLINVWNYLFIVEQGRFTPRWNTYWSMKNKKIWRHTSLIMIRCVDIKHNGCIFHLLKKGNLRITTNYRGLTLTAIASKVYNSLFLNCIRSEIEKILGKNQNSFRRNRSTIS